MRRRTSAGCRSTSNPATRARPPVGASIVLRMWKSVDLPPPFGPSTPKISPSRTSNDTPESATRAPYRCTRFSAATITTGAYRQQQSVEQGQVNHGREKDLPRTLSRTVERHPQPGIQEYQAECERTEKINGSRHSQKARSQARRNQQQPAEHDLARGRLPVGLDHRQHNDPGALVVFAIHPGNGKEVRKLPQEKDSEECPGFGSESSGRGRIPDQRRHRAGERADRGCVRRTLFQWRVQEQVASKRRQAPERGHQVHLQGEIHEAEDRKRDPENQRTLGADTARWNRPPARPPHLRIRAALVPLVQRSGAGRQEAGAEQRVERRQPAEAAAVETEIITDGRAHQDEPGNSRLRQFEVVPHGRAAALNGCADAVFTIPP